MVKHMVGNCVPDDFIYRELRAWIPDTDKPDSELRRLIKWAHTQNLKPSAGGNCRPNGNSNYAQQLAKPSIKAFQPTNTGLDLPRDLADTTPSEFLLRIFRPTDSVCVSYKDENGEITDHSVYTVKDLVELAAGHPEYQNVFEHEDGVYYRINPVKGEGRKDEHIADFRHVLVELEVKKPERYKMTADQIGVRVKEFYASLKASKLPIAAIYTSGDETVLNGERACCSVHALVEVNAPSYEQWKERQGVVFEYCKTMPGFDASNSNPSRLSRLPGAMRGNSKQTLLDWHNGLISYDEFCEELTRRAMIGGSILDYANAPIDDSATLLGNRYLCRCGGMFIVAPSGKGKSSLAAYLATEWAIGGDPLGIKANGELRTLIMQAEDDMGDLTEMTRWITEAGFTEDKLLKIARNTHIEPVNDVVGDRFLDVLDSLCKQWRPDIVIINPYTSYLGDDAKDEKAANHFLRECLTPVLKRHQCAAIIMHHTPKTQFSPSADFTTTDFMYRGSGCASMTNWARAYLVFEPANENGLFRFVAAKRGERIGWNRKVRFFRHSRVPGVIKWEQADTEEVEAVLTKKQGNAKPPLSDSDLLSMFSETEPITKAQALHAMQQKGASQRSAKDAFQCFCDDGRIVKAPFGDDKSKNKGRPATRYLLGTVFKANLDLADSADE
jgi:RecA-family ATPase